MTPLWIIGGRLIGQTTAVKAALEVDAGRVVAVREWAPRGAKTIDARGGDVAPGFVDLHVWGEPDVLARELPRHGTTAFLTTLGPAPADQLIHDIERRVQRWPTDGAACLGFHLEGPFLNPVRGGALPKRWMRAPTVRELRRLWEASGRRVRLITLAPELRGAEAAIRWCRQRRIAVSLGHSDADAQAAQRGVQAGATAVTHVFNGMPPFHHRRPSLVDVALTDPRLTAMAILDGVHISGSAFRALVKAKGSGRVALVTDSVRHAGWDVLRRGAAFYLRGPSTGSGRRPADKHAGLRGTLAGSALTMMQAVRNAAAWGGVPLAEAVRMATEIPARLIGDRRRGTLSVGSRADLVVFDRQFRVQMTLVGGHVTYQRNSMTTTARAPRTAYGLPPL